MRWRNASEEVATSNATSSSTQNNSRRSLNEQTEEPESSNTTTTLSSAAGDGHDDAAAAAAAATAAIDIATDKSTSASSSSAESSSSSLTATSASTNSGSSSNSALNSSSNSHNSVARGQKRSLEHEKNRVISSNNVNDNVNCNVNTEHTDAADTTTSAAETTTTNTSTSTTAQQNTRNISSSSNANSNNNNNGGSSCRKMSDDEEDGDEYEEEEDDDDDDDGADHAEDDTASKPSITWKPQNITSTCEFTHTILDYSQKRESGCKKAEYSAVTQDELGNRWRLIVYVNGNGRASNHHLSLFLQVADADDLPFGWKKAVSYVLTLEHPSADATLAYAKRNPDKTFKLCPKAIDWGWSQFITSDRIQQEGYVKADTLTVRAQVTVKSSSVAIDEEDSELYLKCAVEEGEAKSVKLCLDQGASVNCQFKDDLYTPLHTACSSGTGTGSMDVLLLLLESGADGNACNKWKETPLLIAANNGHHAAVEALLKHGANPSLCSEAGWSALTFAAHKVRGICSCAHVCLCACAFCLSSLVNSLIGPLLRRQGYDDIVALLLKAGAPINCPVTEDASTPLHKACAGSKPGHLAAVKLLLDGGADVHALNKWRETPLLTAANHGQTGALEALLAADADPCKCTDTGWSPLSIAAYKGHNEVVRMLLEDGAPTEEDDPTLSALLQAATKGLPDTVELLLRHGADHTVTTKKGDTALSILVEQNLIDAAVEMVAEYNASIPRCSRDRKKVQRARLLINLRMKQLEREGNDNHDSTFEDEDTDDELSSDAMAAHHVENGSLDGSAIVLPGKKNRKGIPKESLEEKARLAEEALLLELENEDAKAKMEEAKANSKQAKKKKKKERERQQKMKEDDERRQQEEEEASERDRIRKDKEEKRRKELEVQQKLDREREIREMMDREKHMAAKRKERKEREKLELAQKAQAIRGPGTTSPVEMSSSNTVSKDLRAQTDPTPKRKLVSAKGGKKPSAPLSGNRRWETAAKGTVLLSNAEPARSNQVNDIDSVTSKPVAALSGNASGVVLPLVTESKNGTNQPIIASKGSLSLGQSDYSLPSQNLQRESGTLDHPAVALFRRDKVNELIHHRAHGFNFVDQFILKRVVYRWMIRASHGTDAYIDSIIPSWFDHGQLVEFFQRQFIAETRRRSSENGNGPSLQTFKEAGSSIALFCLDLANQVSSFRHRVFEQLSTDWTDVTLGMAASDGTLSGNGDIVTVSWENRAHVFIPARSFASLRERHVGLSSLFLSATFVTRVFYDTTRLILSDTNLDMRLSPSTQAVLSSEINVTAELWSDPFSAMQGNVFWGHFEHVDGMFGGQKPFGKDIRGSEELLTRHGGSVSAFLPLDATIASTYVRRIVDLLDAAYISGVPLSFALFCGSDSFHDCPTKPSASDLRMLDPRLGDQQSVYITFISALNAGQHTFFGCEGSGVGNVCATGSLFVLLQNEPGKSRFHLNDRSTSQILATLTLNTHFQNADVMSLSMDVPVDFNELTHNLSYFEETNPTSPDPQRIIRSDFGAIGGSTLSRTLSPAQDVFSRGGRRGRLFDLIDDGEDEHFNDDIMSGMLNTLDVGLFQNANVGSEVDIEAISLMGIGGPARSLSSPGISHPGRLR